MRFNYTKANQETKKLFKWFLSSGALLTFLLTAQQAISDLDQGTIDLEKVARKLSVALAFMVVNASIFYVSKAREKDDKQ